MSRPIILLFIVALVAACGGRQQFSAPRNLDDACLLATERPQYFAAMQATERRWGIAVPVQMAIIHAESRFIGDARTPVRYTLGVIPMGRQSSALGYSQALDGTWEEYQRETGSRRAARTNIRDATDFVGWYANKTRERNGVALNDARNQYLAYHEGHTGFARASYNAKPWLLGVADRVASRAQMYDQQLRSCRRR
ncbi:lytic transglycosylase [Roseinatronobacter alkalisoli]|uniref:Lytic transglycosylase n=1 Tax=Roseinatronobacter alkalisoli TaxID=3028235 RepID=A0ABT5T4Z6_9RHOB|nr:lytic transglycosylase [Roseinatronobacter sp. HJB301]MDD7970200.1 lytic transglycosylase [Roseinatronobacter sp. HJB301]